MLGMKLCEIALPSERKAGLQIIHVLLQQRKEAEFFDVTTLK